MSEAIKHEYIPMQTLIRLVSAGAREECINELQVDWQTVLPLAAEQNVLSLVACALRYSPELECPPELREHLMNTMRNEAAINLIRRQRILRLLTKMKETGIDAKVLKGYAVAGYYAHPECRGAVDTDLYVELHQEQQALRFLENLGFKVSIRGSTSHHSVCQHKKYGMLELHVALYAELIREVWFCDVDEQNLISEDFIDVCDDVGEYKTLGHTDHLLFLALHMIKHFILEGLTLRMMLDIALYFSKNQHLIDAERFWRIMSKLNYSYFLNCILWCMIEFGGFKETDFSGISSTMPEDLQFVLSDLVQGGYLGQKEKEERHKSGMEYNRLLMLRRKNQWQYMQTMAKWKIKSGLNAMFPTKHQLTKKYPCLESRKYLLPFIYAYNVISFPIKNKHQLIPGRDILYGRQTSSGIVDQRVKLFHRLKLLD